MIQSALVVDDYEPDRHFTTMMLERSKRFRHVFATDSAEEALRLFEQYQDSRTRQPDAFPPMVVLLDINMPRMNGFEFLDEFERLRVELPNGSLPSVIVMLSSSHAERDRDRAQEYNSVIDYVEKPLSIDRAAALADALVENDAAKEAS